MTGLFDDRRLPRLANSEIAVTRAPASRPSGAAAETVARVTFTIRSSVQDRIVKEYLAHQSVPAEVDDPIKTETTIHADLEA